MKIKKSLVKERYLEQSDEKFRPLYFSIFLSLFCIFFQEQARIIFFREFAGIKNTDLQGSLTLWWAVGQCIGFPIMGYFSDVMSRKKVLGFCLVCLTLSLVFLHFGYIYSSIVFYSIGAVSAVARAAFCEIHVEHIEHKLREKRAPNILYTFIIQPLPWLFFAYGVFNFPGIFHNFSYLTTIQGVVLFHLIWNYLEDPRGRGTHEGLIKEWKKAKGKVIAIRGGFATLIVIFTFYFGESIWISAQYYMGMDPGAKIAGIGKDLDISLGFSFLLGSLVVLSFTFNGWASKYVEVFLSLVFMGVAFVILGYYLHWRIGGYNGDVIKNMFPYVTFLGGMGLPLIYVFFGGSKKIGTHLLGMIYGLIEALQNLTDISGAYFEKIFNIYFHKSEFVLILFFVFFVSFLFYIYIVIYKWRNNKFQGGE